MKDKKTKEHISVRSTVGWLGFITTMLGLALYFMVRVGEDNNYTTGNIVMAVGLVVMVGSRLFKH